MPTLRVRLVSGSIESLEVPAGLADKVKARDPEAVAQVKHAAETQALRRLAPTVVPAGGPKALADADVERPIKCPVCREVFTLRGISEHVARCHREFLERLDAPTPVAAPKAPESVLGHNPDTGVKE